MCWGVHTVYHQRSIYSREIMIKKQICVGLCGLCPKILRPLIITPAQLCLWVWLHKAQPRGRPGEIFSHRFSAFRGLVYVLYRVYLQKSENRRARNGRIINLKWRIKLVITQVNMHKQTRHPHAHTDNYTSRESKLELCDTTLDAP